MNSTNMNNQEKNRLESLSQNPHYTMSDQDIERLANLLREELASQSKEKGDFSKTTFELPKKVNKNRVKKTPTEVEKTTGLEEA